MLRSGPATVYLLINAGASLAALWLAKRYKVVAADETQWIEEALLAGFGAVAFFRTSLFMMRINNSDIAIGPSAFLQIILAAVDREIDRNEAKPRADAVRETMATVDFNKAYLALPTFCFGLMQNVSPEEQRSVGTEIDRLANSSLNDDVKSLSLGLILINVVGEAVLRDAVEALGEKIQSDPPR